MLSTYVTYIWVLSVAYCNFPLDVSVTSPEPYPVLECYRRRNGGNYSVETCDRTERCCIGMVIGDLAVNETQEIYSGGCFHDPGRTNLTCVHRYTFKTNISVCQCTERLCNYHMLYQEPLPVILPPDNPGDRITPIIHHGPNIYSILGAVLGLILLCVLLGCIAFIVYKRYIKKRHNFTRLGDRGDDHELQVPRFPNGKVMGSQYDRVSEIEIIRDIGHGRYGQVQQAKVGDTFIAIKKFSPYDRQSFLNELMIMTEKRDSNLLLLLGFIDNQLNNQLWLLTEYMELGNMSDYLRSHTLTIPQALHLLSSFISGVCFLHSEPQPVAHRDIKTRNVLLADHKTAKLADFGLALLLDYGPGGALNEKAAPPTQVGTARYMAPEVLEGSMFYREAEAHMRIDVYSASLVMWEIMWRTQLDPRDAVPPYYLPYERKMPGNPSACDMQGLVAVEKQRPELRVGWVNHSTFNTLETTLTESWDNDENARLSSKTIQARLLNLLSNESDSEVSV